jgi:hypothetical protein
MDDLFVREDLWSGPYRMERAALPALWRDRFTFWDSGTPAVTRVGGKGVVSMLCRWAGQGPTAGSLMSTLRDTDSYLQVAEILWCSPPVRGL